VNEFVSQLYYRGHINESRREVRGVTLSWDLVAAQPTILDVGIVIRKPPRVGTGRAVNRSPMLSDDQQNSSEAYMCYSLAVHGLPLVPKPEHRVALPNVRH